RRGWRPAGGSARGKSPVVESWLPFLHGRLVPGRLAPGLRANVRQTFLSARAFSHERRARNRWQQSAPTFQVKRARHKVRCDVLTITFKGAEASSNLPSGSGMYIPSPLEGNGQLSISAIGFGPFELAAEVERLVPAIM